jgi:hypothetical protein
MTPRERAEVLFDSWDNRTITREEITAAIVEATAVAERHLRRLAEACRTRNVDKDWPALKPLIDQALDLVSAPGADRAVTDIHARGNLARRIQEIRSAVERERDEARADVATLTKWDERKTRRIAELEAALRKAANGPHRYSNCPQPLVTTELDCSACTARTALSAPAQPATAAKQNHVGDIDDTHFDGDDCPAAPPSAAAREPCPDCQSSTREHGICDCWTAEEMRQAHAVDDNSSSRDKKI